MYVSLHVKCLILFNLQFGWQISVKIINTKFHRNSIHQDLIFSMWRDTQAGMKKLSHFLQIDKHI
jgi:hypothetical protein